MVVALAFRLPWPAIRVNDAIPYNEGQTLAGNLISDGFSDDLFSEMAISDSSSREIMQNGEHSVGL